MSKFDKYVKATNWYKNKTTIGGGGGSAGAFVEEEKPTYKPIDFNLFLKAPSTEAISQKQDLLLKYENDFQLLDTTIDEDYINWQDYGKQLDDLELQLQEAPPEMQFKLTNDYNKARDIYNGLVDKIKVNTAQQKKIKEEYDVIRGSFDKDLVIYNKWAEAQNRKEPSQISSSMDRYFLGNIFPVNSKYLLANFS